MENGIGGSRDPAAARDTFPVKASTAGAVARTSFAFIAVSVAMPALAYRIIESSHLCIEERLNEMADVSPAAVW